MEFVSAFCTEINAPELSADQVAALLYNDPQVDGHRFQINGEDWEYRVAGGFQRVFPRRRARTNRGVGVRGCAMTVTFPEMRTQLDRLNRLDRGRRIFASFKHQYRLNPPLPEGRVQKIEKLIRVTLPEQYRRFVTEFADGGAGPKYGILPLQRLLDRAFPRRLLQSLASPFPASRSVRKMREVGFDPPGTLEVCEIGCGGMFHLVVSGRERGYVWLVNPEGDWGPALSDESYAYQGAQSIEAVVGAALRAPRSLKLEFVDWYAKWLDESLRHVEAKRGKKRRRHEMWSWGTDYGT
jgi:hypothetical protein